MVYLWTEGDLTGTVTVGRNVGSPQYPYYADYAEGPIFSFGSIDLAIHALNPSSDPLGGNIGAISAWGPISGDFHAAASIAAIDSGDSVTATLDAPSVGTVVEQDSTIRTLHPRPDVPTAVRDAVLAEAATAYGDVLTAKGQIAAGTATLLAQYAAAKATTQSASKAALDKAIGDTTTANAAADLAARESLINAIASEQVARFKQATTSATSLDAARTKAAADLTSFQARTAALRDAVPASLAAAEDARQAGPATLAGLDDDMSKAKADSLAHDDDARQAREKAIAKMIADARLRQIRSVLRYVSLGVTVTALVVCLVFGPPGWAVAGMAATSGACLATSGVISLKLGDYVGAFFDFLGAGLEGATVFRNPQGRLHRPRRRGSRRRIAGRRGSRYNASGVHRSQERRSRR